MNKGDPMPTVIRRNVATLSQAEREQFREALLQLDKSKFYPDGVSFWDKQDAIHQSTHVHNGPAFLPWHRELCNRFEKLLQEVDPDVALHYWDWTTDPRNSPDGVGGTVNLFTNTFMGSPSGRAGTPLDTFDNGGVFVGSRQDTGNPADAPQAIVREVGAGAPNLLTIFGFRVDADMLTVGNALPQSKQYKAFREAVENMHNSIHGYIGGTIGNAHTAFEDPFVFLLHSNVDRLFAMWQTTLGQMWRLDPEQVYGDDDGAEIQEFMEPWAGLIPAIAIRPWAPPENEQESKNAKDPSVVMPPQYDTMPVIEGANGPHIPLGV
jgi:hypothetical protein